MSSRYSIHERDAFPWLEEQQPESVDLIVTDPPYESMEKHRAIGTTTRLKHSKASSNDWFKTISNARFPYLFKLMRRVLKPNAHCYVFCDSETAFIIKPMGEAAGFKFWKPLIWDKQKIGMGYHWRARYEMILFFEKGKLKLNDLGAPDVIECPRIHRGYPTEKPVTVSEKLILNSSRVGQLVMDPFMGSGSVGVAALQLGRRFVGNDLCAEAFTVAHKRLHSIELGRAIEGSQ